MGDGTRLAGVKLHPAVIVIGGVVAAGSVHQSWPIVPAGVFRRGLESLGAALVGTGVVILVLAYGHMIRYRTTINPRRHSRTIVTTGIYRFSRNPIYVGWFTLLVGQGLARNNLLVILIAVAMIGLLHWAVVVEEEKYLERAFGEEYLAYKRRVRRWL